MSGFNGPSGVCHCLKIWPEYWRAVYSFEKNFEVRRDDRGFRVGDILTLQEWSPATGEYTGNSCRRIVRYILPGGQFGIESGFVVLGMEAL